jgi:hypothetical protein
LDLVSRNKFWELRISLVNAFPELNTSLIRPTTDGEPYIAKPSGCLFIHTIHDDTNDAKLSYRPFRWYIEQTGHATAASENKPKYWTPYGSTIYLDPTPDATYDLNVYYRQRPTLLSAGTDTTAIGDEWDEVIIRLATVKAMIALHMYAEMKTEKEALLDILASKLGILNNEEKDTKRHFEVDIGYHQWGYR